MIIICRHWVLMDISSQIIQRLTHVTCLLGYMFVITPFAVIYVLTLRLSRFWVEVIYYPSWNHFLVYIHYILVGELTADTQEYLDISKMTHEGILSYLNYFLKKFDMTERLHGLSEKTSTKRLMSHSGSTTNFRTPRTIYDTRDRRWKTPITYLYTSTMK